MWFWQILIDLKNLPSLSSFLDNSSASRYHSTNQLGIGRLERSQHCFISDLLLFISFPPDSILVPQLSGCFNFQISVPNPGSGSRAGLSETDWAGLCHLIVPKIITKKSQRESVLSNTQITLTKKVLNDISTLGNVSHLFLLSKLLIRQLLILLMGWYGNQHRVLKKEQTKRAPNRTTDPKGAPELPALHKF